MNITGMGSAFDCMVMQNYQDKENVIELFKSGMMQGYNPEDIEQTVYQQAGVDPATFSNRDKREIEQRVNELYQQLI